MSPVIVAAFVAAFLHFLSTYYFGAGARVDVGEVCRVGLRQAADVQFDPDPASSLREGGGSHSVRAILGPELDLGGVAHPVAKQLLHVLDLRSLRSFYGLREPPNLRAVGAPQYGFGHRYGGAMVGDHKAQEEPVGHLWRCCCRRWISSGVAMPGIRP